MADSPRGPEPQDPSPREASVRTAAVDGKQEEEVGSDP